MGLILKIVLLLLASFLSVSIRASYMDEDLQSEGESTLCTVKEPTPTRCSMAAPPPLPPVLLPPSAPQPPLLINPPVQPPAEPPVPIIECVSKCLRRCKWHWRRKICFWGCMKCCSKCKCVPPGIYGNRDKCGKCYTDMTNRRGKPMFP